MSLRFKSRISIHMVLSILNLFVSARPRDKFMLSSYSINERYLFSLGQCHKFAISFILGPVERFMHFICHRRRAIIFLYLFEPFLVWFRYLNFPSCCSSLISLHGYCFIFTLGWYIEKFTFFSKVNSRKNYFLGSRNLW